MRIYLDPFRPVPQPLVRIRETETTSKSDGWENSYTGFGTTRDKTIASAFCPVPPINDVELEALYHNSSIAAKGIEKVIQAAFRAGIELEGDEDGKVLKWLNTFAIPHVKWAATLGRIYGGAILWLGTKDDPSTAWNQDQPILFLEELDRRYVTPWTWYKDTTSPKYGQPETYLVSDPLVGRSVRLHETRVIRFDGVKTDKRTRLNFLKGWGFSVLQRPYEDLRSAGVSFRAIENLLSDASQAVYGIKNLNAKLATDAEETVRRLRLLDMQRSTGRGIALDAENETFERSATPFSGIPDIIDRVMIMISSAFDMPCSIMFGRQPSGLQATGEIEDKGWHNSIREYQDQITPALELLTRLGAITLKMNPEKVTFSFCNPAQPNQLEQAQVYKSKAEGDSTYVLAGVLLPEEVALSRFGPENEAGIELQDEGAREASLKIELENMKNPPEVNPDEQVPGQKPSGSPQGGGKAPVPGSSPGA